MQDTDATKGRDRYEEVMPGRYERKNKTPSFYPDYPDSQEIGGSASTGPVSNRKRGRHSAEERNSDEGRDYGMSSVFS